jgi:hypothetical protein
VNLFRFIPGYESAVYDEGREPALVMLLAFLITFVFTRGYTRIARVRGWGSANVGGVHMHHVVVGMVLAFVAGALEFGFTPAPGFFQLLLAAAFGSGAALVLDEFALVFRLEDVYWEKEGRSSIDAIVISTVLGVVLLEGTAPFATEGEASWGLFLSVAITCVFVFITALKGKLLTAAFGVFLPFLAVVGASRLAKPGSLWARKFYRSGSRKRTRSEARYARYAEKWGPRKERFWDLIGGATGRPEQTE